MENVMIGCCARRTREGMRRGTRICRSLSAGWCLGCWSSKPWFWLQLPPGVLLAIWVVWPTPAPEVNGIEFQGRNGLGVVCWPGVAAWPSQARACYLSAVLDNRQSTMQPPASLLYNNRGMQLVSAAAGVMPPAGSDATDSSSDVQDTPSKAVRSGGGDTQRWRDQERRNEGLREELTRQRMAFKVRGLDGWLLQGPPGAPGLRGHCTQDGGVRRGIARA